MLQKRKGNFGGFPGGGGRGGMGLAGTLIILGIGTWAASNALFNGMNDPYLGLSSYSQAT